MTIVTLPQAGPTTGQPLSSAMAGPGPDLLATLEHRRSVEPSWLAAPGPSEDELHRILTVASRVPDHGMLVPWRFVLIRGSARAAISARFGAAHHAWVQAHQADWLRTEPEQVQRKTDKLSGLLTHAPLIVTVVSTADPAARKPEWEQVLTAGAVCMNLTAAATALGYGSVWLTGFPAYDPACLDAIGVKPREKVAGFIHIGTASKRPADRKRPDLATLVTDLVA